MANLRQGLNAAAETLPHKWFEAPGFKDYASETPLRREDAQHMIQDYYDEWGWDRTSGVPTPARLAELGLTKDG